MERAINRREFIRDGTAFSLAFPSLPGSLFSPDKTRIIFDVTGYMVPEVASDKEGLVVSHLGALGAKSAVIINPSLSLVTTLQQRNIDVIVRPYLKHNQFDPAILRRFMHYPGKLIWLPFVEPNLPEVIGEVDETNGECKDLAVLKRVFHDPEEFAVNNFAPSVRTILSHNERKKDTILIPHTAPWRVENEYDFAEIMYRAVKREITQGRLPVENLGVSINCYFKKELSEPEKADPWPRNISMHAMSAFVFEKELPLYISEAGLHQDAKSSYTPGQVAYETERLLVTHIPSQLERSLQRFNVWVLGYLSYVPHYYHQDKCNGDKIRGFEKAAIVGVNGPTETFNRIKDLSKRRTAELRRIALQGI